MQINAKSIGYVVRLVRKRKGHTQQDMANEIGITRNYIALVERGNRDMSFITLRKFAEYAGLPLGDIIFLSLELEEEKKFRVIRDMIKLQNEIFGSIGKV